MKIPLSNDECSWIIMQALLFLIYFNYYYQWVECFELLNKTNKYVLPECTGLTKAFFFVDKVWTFFVKMLFWTSVSLCTRAAIQLRNDAFYLNWTHTEVLNLISSGKFNDSCSLSYIIILSKYFPGSDWLKAHVELFWLWKQKWRTFH